MKATFAILLALVMLMPLSGKADTLAGLDKDGSFSNEKNSYLKLVKVIIDSQVPISKRLDAYESIIELSPKYQYQALTQITEEAQEAIAAMAGGRLIEKFGDNYQDSAKIDRQISGSIGHWTGYGENIVLQSLLIKSIGNNYPKIPKECARQILAQYVSKDKSLISPQRDDQENDAVNKAGFILVQDKDGHDTKLVHEAVEVSSRWPMPWFLLQATDKLTTDEISIARHIYQNDIYLRPVRLACAIVLAPLDEKANYYAKSELTSLISEQYTNESVDTNIGRKKLRMDLFMLSFIRYSKSEWAPEIAQKASKSGDAYIKSMGLLLLTTLNPGKVSMFPDTQSGQESILLALSVRTNPLFVHELSLRQRKLITIGENEIKKDNIVLKFPEAGSVFSGLYQGEN